MNVRHKIKIQSFTLMALAMCAALQAAQKPNVILIMADDMGIETVGVYGSQTYKTPNIDALAARGVRFNNCTATPICTPSRVKLMTGQHTFHNYAGFGTYPAGDKSIGNLMSCAGYATACYGKWQLKGATPDEVGFDEYLCGNGGIPGEKGDRYWDGCYGDHNRQSVHFSEVPDHDGAKAYGPDLLLYRLKDFISRQAKADKPFFVYYPMFLVHWPFVKTPDSKGDGSQPQYFEDMVAYADKIVGEIVAHLDKLGLTENTLIMFTGDNGTYPGLAGIMADGRRWEGAKSTPIRPGQQVPLVAALGHSAPKTSDEVIDFTDILPTLADAGNAVVNLKKDYNCFGRSLLPTITGEGQAQKKMYTISWYPSIGSRPYSEALFVCDGTYKLYYGDLLFNIKEDPFELHPIYSYTDTKESKAARMRLADYLNECFSRWPRLKKFAEPEPQIVATWRDSQIPQNEAVDLEWDITPHLVQSEMFVPGEFGMEAVAYYGFSRLSISNLAIYCNGEKVAEPEPESGVTQYALINNYQYAHLTKGNLFRFNLPGLDKEGRYILKATLKREPFKNPNMLHSQANGYLYIHSGSDWQKEYDTHVKASQIAQGKKKR